MNEKTAASIAFNKMEMNIRRQLTLFVDKLFSHEIEAVRGLYNPKQKALIDSHVTLCREDEIKSIENLVDYLKGLQFKPISIKFGEVIRFDNGLGVMLPSSGDNDEYHQLRSQILTPFYTKIQTPEPHITLMHPRNSICTDHIFEQIKEVKFPSILKFETISLIEQTYGGKWKILVTF